MASVSLCMIVRDEEAVLERCLAGVADIVEEIVIVDTGSLDRTKEIAARFTEAIYDFPWQEDFAAARNFAFSKGTQDYLMWLDADDVLPAEEGEKLRRLKEELSADPVDVVMLPYDAAFDEKGKPTFSYFRERLLRNCGQARWEGRVHECIPLFGTVRYGEVHILHKKEKAAESGRNLHIYKQMLREGLALTPREQFYYGRELFYQKEYESCEAVLRNFLKEEGGWTENKLEACRLLSLALLEKGQEEKALEALFSSLKWEVPNGELCCAIGHWFFEKGQWRQAAFWYENALRAKPRRESGAFIEEECYGYLPAVQLCVCYDRLGEWERARAYNEMAGAFKPQDSAVAINREYFRSRKS